MSELNIRDRMALYLEFKGISDYRFEKDLGLSKGYWNKAKNPTSEIVRKFVGIYTDISSDWLLTGKGEMLKKEDLSTNNNSGTIYGSQGGTNNGNYNNIGNNYNFTLPEKGHVKIIRPDGTVSTESYNSDIENRLAELEALREKIVVLDKLVKSQEEQIELYKMKIDMLEHRQ